MNAPTESGWYWARYETERWEVVYFYLPAMEVHRARYEIEFDVSEFKEWGERVERKGGGK